MYHFWGTLREDLWLVLKVFRKISSRPRPDRWQQNFNKLNLMLIQVSSSARMINSNDQLEVLVLRCTTRKYLNILLSATFLWRNFLMIWSNATFARKTFQFFSSRVMLPYASQRWTLRLIKTKLRLGLRMIVWRLKILRLDW